MIRRIRPRSLYDVLAALAFFGVIAGGTAYAANTVFSTDIVDGQVKAVDLGDGAVTNAKLADSAVGKAEIAAGAVENGKLANGAVGASKLANGAATNAKVADGAVTTQKVLNGSLTGSDIGDNTLTSSDIDESTLGPIGETVPAVRATAPEAGNFYDGECYNETPYVQLASPTVISFSAEDYDIGGLHTTTSNCETAGSRLTAPTTGIYLITGTARWLGEDNNCTGCEYGIREVEIRKDGNNTLARDTVPAAVVAGGFEIQNHAPNQTVTTVARLAANSYVELLARHNHASSTLQYLDGSGTNFTMTWLGPAA